MKVVPRASALGLATLLACLAVTSTRGDENVIVLRYPEKQTAHSPVTQSTQNAVQQTAHTASRGGPPKQIALLAQGEADFEPEPVAEPESYSEPIPYESVTPWDDGSSGCDSCGSSFCDGCGDDGCGNCQRGCLGNLWFGGVDYILFRPRMSQAVAAVRRQETSDTSSFPASSTVTDTVIEFPFDYNSAFRVFAGYRLLDCGGDFQVSYWRLTDSARITEGPANPSTNDPFIAGNLENNPGPGQFLNASSGITANIFDVEFTKCISLGGPRDCCDPCPCPRWDLRFFAGARAGDIIRYNDNNVTAANGDIVSYGNIGARFTGGGPRIGFQSRRYLGYNGCWSVYAKGAQSILIGEYRMDRRLTVPSDGTTPNQFTNQFNTYSRTIPVTDIELGLSWQPAPFTLVSVGYFWQCWWDLGQSEQIQGTNFSSLDTANILGFDGLFVRGEMMF